MLENSFDEVEGLGVKKVVTFLQMLVGGTFDGTLITLIVRVFPDLPLSVSHC